MVGKTWKCAIENNYASSWVGILFYEERGDKVTIHRLKKKDDEEQGLWESTTQDTFVAIDKPSLYIPRDVLPQLLAALTEQGIKMPSEHKVAGLYEAQSKHLDDLRHLLKLDKK